MFYNEEHERRIAEVEAQKKALMQDDGMQAVYERMAHAKDDNPMLAAIYKDMENFYKKPGKHDSPTRRLRQQKDTCWEHKEFLSQQPEFWEDSGNYGQTYVVGTSKTYVVQPT
jgi:hypothetical protein